MEDLVDQPGLHFYLRLDFHLLYYCRRIPDVEPLLLLLVDCGDYRRHFSVKVLLLRFFL